MSTRGVAMPEAANARSLQAQLQQRWRALALRERTAVALMAAVVGVVLVWLIAVRPAWRTLREAPAQLAQADAELQHMQTLAEEARGLRGAAPVSPQQAAAALRAATDRLAGGSTTGGGAAAPSARLALQGDRATLTLSNVNSDALRAWLGEARSAARARPIELQLTRTASGFSGSVVVALSASAGANP